MSSSDIWIPRPRNPEEMLESVDALLDNDVATMQAVAEARDDLQGRNKLLLANLQRFAYISAGIYSRDPAKKTQNAAFYMAVVGVGYYLLDKGYRDAGREIPKIGSTWATRWDLENDKLSVANGRDVLEAHLDEARGEYDEYMWPMNRWITAVLEEDYEDRKERELPEHIGSMAAAEVYIILRDYEAQNLIAGQSVVEASSIKGLVIDQASVDSTFASMMKGLNLEGF